MNKNAEFEIIELFDKMCKNKYKESIKKCIEEEMRDIETLSNIIDIIRITIVEEEKDVFEYGTTREKVKDILADAFPIQHGNYKLKTYKISKNGISKVFKEIENKKQYIKEMEDMLESSDE